MSILCFYYRLVQDSNKRWFKYITDNEYVTYQEPWIYRGMNRSELDESGFVEGDVILVIELGPPGDRFGPIVDMV